MLMDWGWESTMVGQSAWTPPFDAKPTQNDMRRICATSLDKPGDGQQKRTPTLPPKLAQGPPATSEFKETQQRVAMAWQTRKHEKRGSKPRLAANCEAGADGRDLLDICGEAGSPGRDLVDICARPAPLGEISSIFA